MVPSSLTSSQSTPAGWWPARRARSTAASVWPARSSTPPRLERRGKTWPGRRRSSGVVAGSMSDCDRACAVGGGDAGGGAVAGVDGEREGGAHASLPSSLMSGSSSCSSRSRSIGDADDPGAVADHERERLGCRRVGGDDQVALVLAILVVDHHDHPAAADRRDRSLDTRTHTDLLEGTRARAQPPPCGRRNLQAVTNGPVFAARPAAAARPPRRRPPRAARSGAPRASRARGAPGSAHPRRTRPRAHRRRP